MGNQYNKHGLKRNIPAQIKRQVRWNSKFGCIICRRGFYQYEHIDPPFEECTEHRAENICCLCASCHDQVTRGQLAKQSVKSAYEKIKASEIGEIEPPKGPLDFYDGSAELVFGGLRYTPVVKSVLRYHGQDLIQVIPGENREPGKINACFTDNQGQISLMLVENEWIGSLENWDIEITGQKMTVRREKKDTVLKIRLDPPGKIIIEKLDMKFRESHILATENTYAVGRYITENFLRWVHVPIAIDKSSANGVVIEFTDTEALEVRDIMLSNQDIPESANEDRSMVINAIGGAMIKPLGISIESNTGSFKCTEFGVSNDMRLNEMRQAVFKSSGDVMKAMVNYNN